MSEDVEKDGRKHYKDRAVTVHELSAACAEVRTGGERG